jgi:ribose 5-phosphate isomerase B
MKIHLGTDHAGFDFKNALAEHLKQLGHDVVDHGAHSFDAEDDYPAFCIAAAEAVAADSSSLGIVIGGSGNGEQIAANKVVGIRAALAWSVETAVLAREHNNANVVSIGARMHQQDLAFEISQVSDFETR